MQANDRKQPLYEELQALAVSIKTMARLLLRRAESAPDEPLNSEDALQSALQMQGRLDAWRRAVDSSPHVGDFALSRPEIGAELRNESLTQLKLALMPIVASVDALQRRAYKDWTADDLERHVQRLLDVVMILHNDAELEKQLQPGTVSLLHVLPRELLENVVLRALPEATVPLGQAWLSKRYNSMTLAHDRRSIYCFFHSHSSVIDQIDITGNVVKSYPVPSSSLPYIPGVPDRYMQSVYSRKHRLLLVMGTNQSGCYLLSDSVTHMRFRDSFVPKTAALDRHDDIWAVGLVHDSSGVWIWYFARYIDDRWQPLYLLRGYGGYRDNGYKLFIDENDHGLLLPMDDFQPIFVRLKDGGVSVTEFPSITSTMQQARVADISRLMMRKSAADNRLWGWNWYEQSLNRVQFGNPKQTDAWWSMEPHRAPVRDEIRDFVIDERGRIITMDYRRKQLLIHQLVR